VLRDAIRAAAELMFSRLPDLWMGSGHGARFPAELLLARQDAIDSTHARLKRACV
jgi:hypothetical protein